MKNIKTIEERIMELDEEIVDQTNLLSTLDDESKGYVNVSNHLNVIHTQRARLLEMVDKRKADEDSLELKRKEMKISVEGNKETAKAEKKKNILDGALTVGKIVAETAVPLVLAFICWDIEKDGTIRSKAFPQIGKFKI